LHPLKSTKTQEITIHHKIVKNLSETLLFAVQERIEEVEEPKFPQFDFDYDIMAERTLRELIASDVAIQTMHFIS